MHRDSKRLVVALAGNPNAGKTTIFNNLTGASQHVGNYPGVTVEKKEGRINFGGYRIEFVDLPGTYSLSAHSVEEIIARNFIMQDRPDVVVDIVDASNIERNLYLTTQIVELGIPVVIALNMSDMAESNGMLIDTDYLSHLLGLPIVPTIGNKGKGTEQLLKAVIDTIENGSSDGPSLVNYGKEFEQELSTLTTVISENLDSIDGYTPRWVALKLLENDVEISRMLSAHESSSTIVEAAKKSGERIEMFFADIPAAVITDKRYGFISGACSEAVKMTGESRHDISDKIDLALIHPTLGLIIFAILMWLVFNLTFTLGELPMKWTEFAIASFGDLVASIIPEGLLNSLIVDGVIGGVGGVLSFLPNIMLLFLAIALLEDTGYMARAAFVMDRVMHKIGLHGKSFIPMLIGFGCSVPAYMGSRILEDKADRLVTMHVTTFMSCGARLPVYILVCGAFWPEHAGNVVFSIYAIGVLVAIGTVKLLRSTRFKGMSMPFIMELPPYRIPTVRSLLIHMWERSWLYVRKAGTVILAISIVMWFLMTFPEKTDFSKDYDTLIGVTEAQYDAGAITSAERDAAAAEFENSRAAENIEYSMAGRIGRAIEPVIKPLGFDWRLGIAIVSGFAAKEVVVSTMGTIYGVGDVDEESESLRSKLSTDPQYSRLTAYAFLVFVLLYMPCMAAMAVFLRESGSWKELLFQIGYTTIIAWILSFIVYQGGKFLGFG